MKMKSYLRKITGILTMFILFLTSCKSHHKVTSQPDNLKKLENIYQKYKGVKYRYGGTDRRGFDCSGFVQKVYAEAFQLQLPRTTKAMMKTGKKINKSQLKTGDLVFFHPTRKYYHVGIYMGNGTFIHASTSRGVMRSDMNLNYWKKSYVTARRVLK